MAFEDILEDVGGFGKYQRNLKYLFIVPLLTVIPWFWMNLIFMVSVPDHWCNVPIVKSSNLSIELQRSLISPPENPSCMMYDVNYTALLNEKNFMLSNDTKIIPCTEGWDYDKENYDATISTKWNLVCDRSYYPSLILTMQKIGNFVGTPIFGFLSDKFGRKTVLLLMAFITSLGEIACLLTNDVLVFTILKIIPSTMLSGIIAVAYIYNFELVPPQMRAHMNGIMSLSWTLGLSLLPLIAYLSRNWVIMAIANASAGLFILCYWKYIPESPCWLLSQGRHEEAVVIMKKIGDKNGVNPDEAALFKKLQVLGEDIQKNKEEETHSNFNLLQYPRLRRHFLILTFTGIACNVGYCGLIYNTRNLYGNEFINFFLLSVIEIPSSIVFMIAMDRIGRRWTATFGFICTGLICITPMTGLPYIDIISASIGKFMISGTFMVADQQTSELYPTVTRAFGIGVGKTITSIVTLLLPYLADLSAFGKELPFIIISLVSLTAALLSSFLPETLNENLPQTTTEAELFGSKQKYFSWKRKNPSSAHIPAELKD